MLQIKKLFFISVYFTLERLTQISDNKGFRTKTLEESEIITSLFFEKVDKSKLELN